MKLPVCPQGYVDPCCEHLIDGAMPEASFMLLQGCGRPTHPLGEYPISFLSTHVQCAALAGTSNTPYRARTAAVSARIFQCISHARIWSRRVYCIRNLAWQHTPTRLPTALDRRYSACIAPQYNPAVIKSVPFLNEPEHLLRPVVRSRIIVFFKSHDRARDVCLDTRQFAKRSCP